MSNGEIFIDKSARVDSRAKIGDGTKIWMNVQIRENSLIGENCIISKDVYVDHGVIIGHGCKIQNAAQLYNGLTMGDNVFVGPCVSFTNDKIPRAFNESWKVTKTIVEDGVSIGANATILCGVRLGKFAMIAAGAVVTKDVTPFTLVRGNPAHFVCEIDESGNMV